MVLFANNSTSTLASGISSGATSITLASGKGGLYPAPTGGDFFIATLQEGNTVEIVKCTARSGDVLTVTRAQESTSASAFSTAAVLELRLTSGVMDLLAKLIGNQVFNGSIALTGDASVQFEIGYAGTLGSEVNPKFRQGRLLAAGINLPEYRWMYYSDTVGKEGIVMAIESDGTLAVVNSLNNLRNSHYEAYYTDGTYKPVFRLSSYPLMQLELGAGGTNAAIGHATRASNVVTVQTDQDHSFSQGDLLYVVTNGDPKFTDSAGTIPVASVVDARHFTYADVGSNGSNTVVMSYSIETDMMWRRAGTQHMQLVFGPGTAGQSVMIDFFADSMVTAFGYGASYGGSVLYQPTFLTHADSPYALVAGSTYLCNATSGAVVFDLPAANSYFGKPGRHISIKKTDSSGNAVTVTAAGSDKIDGSGTFALSAQYKFLTIESDGVANWNVFGSN